MNRKNNDVVIHIEAHMTQQCSNLYWISIEPGNEYWKLFSNVFSMVWHTRRFLKFQKYVTLFKAYFFPFSEK